MKHQHHIIVSFSVCLFKPSAFILWHCSAHWCCSFTGVCLSWESISSCHKTLFSVISYSCISSFSHSYFHDYHRFLLVEYSGYCTVYHSEGIWGCMKHILFLSWYKENKRIYINIKYKVGQKCYIHDINQTSGGAMLTAKTVMKVFFFFCSIVTKLIWFTKQPIRWG